MLSSIILRVPRALWPWVAFSLAAGLTLLAWLGVRREERGRIQARFEAQVSVAVDRIAKRMESHEQILRGAAQLMTLRPETTEQDWREYMAALELQRLHPGIQGVGVSLFIPRGRLASHLAEVRAHGHPGYEIRPRGDRPFYSSIVYLEPFDARNRRAFGFDMFSEPIRRESMTRAMDTGLAALSGRITLVQETDTGVQAGTLMYMPIYRRGSSLATVEDRRRALVGWAYSPFRMDDLMEGILGRRPEDMGLEVFDGAGAEPQACLYQSYPGPPLPAGADLPALDRQLEVGGRIWTLRFRPLPGFSQAMGGGTHWQVLLGGTATSLLILLSLLSLSASRKALEASEKHYRLLAENARDVIWTLDAQGRMDYMSPSIQRLRGLTPAEAMAQTLEEGVVAAHASRARVALEAFQQALLTGAPLPDSRIEVEQPRKDGSTVWTETSLNPLLDDQGRYLGVLGVSRDITQRVAAEQERRKLEAEVQHAQKLESLGSLAGGVAHDINNVLAAILSLASMHRQLTRDGEPLARSLDTIVTACERGRDVVRRLLYFARKGLESLGPVDLNILVMEVAHLLDSTTLKRVELQTDLQDGLEPIHGDAAALNHALLNVCINAVEAMPRGGVLRIATRREADGSQEVRVKDTGEGMSPEVAERAVEPFFTTKPVGKGTGLGLSMAYGTLEAHKGSLTIQSEPGKGTEVVLRFPRSH